MTWYLLGMVQDPNKIIVGSTLKAIKSRMKHITYSLLCSAAGFHCIITPANPTNCIAWAGRGTWWCECIICSWAVFSFLRWHRFGRRSGRLLFMRLGLPCRLFCRLLRRHPCWRICLAGLCTCSRSAIRGLSCYSR